MAAYGKNISIHELKYYFNPIQNNVQILYTHISSNISLNNTI